MPASAPLPQAPVFPYQWIGRSEPPLDDATSSATPASQKAFIAGPRTTWLVKPGDVIEGEWRVESVTATALQLTYLPLSSPQTISMPPP